MGMNVSQKLIAAHLISGRVQTGEEIALKVDQTLTQDATGTMVMLEFEALGLSRVRTEVSVQYVDHNLLQVDYRNADDHMYLRSACQRYGLWYSKPGNGVSHPVHMERFGKPGKFLLGADSHTPAAGSMGMLAIGAGGLEVGLAMSGYPYYTTMPKIMGVRLTGKLPDWVSAKDIILEMLRRHGVKGGLGKIVEYYGPGLEQLSAMDRHVICNMGAELGATTSVFPSDQRVREFLRAQAREEDWTELVPDSDATYDLHEEIDLSGLEPLIALPTSPGNVVPVREVAGPEIYQAYIGSSANPGLRDLAISALIVDGRQVHNRVSYDINPTSRQIVENLIALDLLGKLYHAGARVHQCGCNGCIGMGQAPPTDGVSLRTVPRNFPGRSGTRDDKVYLCSPETATASALTGVITDPRTLGFPYPRFEEPKTLVVNKDMLLPPLPHEEAVQVEVIKGPNIKPIPESTPLPEFLHGPVLIKAHDNVSTDEIMPAGAKVLPYRSNIPEISKFTFERLDDTTYNRAMQFGREDCFVIGGDNYGQGSSREHAAIAPRYLGVRAVIAKGFARIHKQNLCNYGIIPLVFVNPGDYEDIDQGDWLKIPDVKEAITQGDDIEIHNETKNRKYMVKNVMSQRQIYMIKEGGLINLVRKMHLVQ